MEAGLETKTTGIAMVVNDDVTQLGVLSALLHKAGLEPLAFGDAESALAAMDREHPPAVLVTDLYMPGIDGWRLCRLLRSPEYAEFNETPIVVVSATFSGDEPGRIAADLGADAFLPCPVDGTRFVSEVRTLLRGRRKRTPLRVLIVEDDKASAEGLRSAFEAEGCRAETAPSAREATAAFAKTAYDVAVLDHHLPDGVGDTLLDAFHALRPDCVCMMMTSDPGPELALDWMRRGAAAYLRKPFAPEYLMELCARARRERALVRAEDLLETRTKELRRSEERYHTLMDTSNEGIWIIDAEDVVTYANPAIAAMLGYAASEMLGATIEQFIFPEDRASHEERMMRRRAGKDDVYERRLRRRDGAALWALVSAKALQDDRGAYVGSLAMLADITERKSAEDALRESESRFRKLAELAPVGIVLSDQEERTLYVSPRFVELFGYSMEDMPCVEHWWSLAYPDEALRDRAKREWAEDLARAREESQTVETSLPVTCRDGTVRQIEFRAASVSGLNIVVFVDITARKRVEEALQESRERLESIFRVAPTGIGVVRDRVLVEVNTRFREMTGYSAEDLLGQSARILYPTQEDFEFVGREKYRQIAARGTGVVESRWRRKDGSVIDVLLASTPLDASDLSKGVTFTALDITERKKAEEQTRYQLGLITSLLNSIPDIVFNKDINGVYLGCNPEFARHVGRPTDEIIGRTDYDLYSKEEADAFRENDRLVLEGGAPRHNEEWVTYPDGRRVLLDTLKAPFYGSDGELLGTLGVSRDVTEQKRVEQALRDSLARNRAILDTVPDLMFLYSPDGVYLDYSASDKSLLAAPPEAFLGRSIHEVLPAEAAGRLAEGIARAQAEPGVQVVEYDLETGQGIRHFEARLAVADAQRILAMVRDVTERVNAEEELRTALADLRKIQGIARLGNWRLSLDTKTFTASEQALDLFGFAPGASPAFDEVADCIHPDDRGKASAMLTRTVDSGKPYSIEIRILKKGTGELRHVHSMGEVQRGADGRHIAVLGSNQDITDRKQAEEERERLQAQLNQAQKMESVGRLAGGVAHDFNNMLSVILGHTEIALEQVDPAQPLHACLLEIRNAAQRSANLTRQLLAFARKQTIAPRVLDLNETVDGMLQMLRRLIGEEIELIWSPAQGLWPVKMDPTQLDQILANLCVNARDAIHSVGRVVIETGTSVLDEDYCAGRPESLPGEFVVLTVSDTGCGMDPETIAKLFEPFFTTKEMGKGTGLGLATVYGIVKQNDGFIEVSSEPGVGTAFRIHLPRHLGKTERVSEESSEEAARAGRGTVLLVEDEPAILHITTMLLERLGYSVLAAATPGEAVRLAETHPRDIHLLMTDVIMPEMNGRDLAKRILSFYPDLHRLFMSGYTADVIAHHGVLEEGVHFIQKPFTMKELAAKLREALGEH